MLYINFFFYSLQYFILINICISQESQEESPDLFSEEISSNIYIKESSPSMRNLIDTVNIEQDEILDLESTYIPFPMEEKNSNSDNEDYPFGMGLIDTINLEKSESCDIANILDEILNTLPDSLTEPIDLLSEHENSTIHAEAGPSSISLIDTKDTEHKYHVKLQNTLSEILSTSPDSQTQSFNLLFEHNYAINVTHGKSFSVNNLMNTENVKQEDPVELQNILDEILNTLPDSLTEPIDLLSEYENSIIHAEAGPSNISLMGTENEKHNDSHKPQSIFNYPSVTPNYLKGEFLNSLLEDQCPSINYEDILPTTSNLMIPENVEHEEYIKLQISPVDFPIEKPATTINYNEDMSLLDEIEQISEESMINKKNEEENDEQIYGKNAFSKQNLSTDLPVINPSKDVSGDNTQSCKKKGKKRNYEDIDNLGDQNIEKDIYIAPKKNCTYQIGADFVYSLSNIFKMQINCLPDSVVPSLQKLRDILDDDNKITYNNIEKKININILLLRDIITEEIQKINPSDLRAIKEYYDKNIEGEKLVKSINSNILLFRHETNHKFDRKAIYEKIKQILEIFEDLVNEHKIFQELYYHKSVIMNKFIYNKLFSISFIQSLEVCKRIFELLKCMDELIECAEKSIKNGFILRDRNYFRTTQNTISSLYLLIISTIKNNFIKLDSILKTLNLSYKDHGIIIETIFYFFIKENVKNKEKLKPYINKPYKQNSLEAIYNFLLEEEGSIMYYYNEAFKFFKLNLSDKNKERMLFNDLINNKDTANNLFSVYETLMKLIGGLFIKRQLTIIMNIRRSLFSINSLGKRKNISGVKILNKEYQLYLLSQIEKEKCKMENIKLNIRNLYLFVTTKDEIKHIQVSDSLINKINGILSILRFICKVVYKDEDKTNLKIKKARMENILLALYYANQRLSEFTENKIQ
ncbi:fam-j protein [Plasmodium relictum]|uniref:Fam-j protein n=1 Tax=Plasmodium relictum TaxID=85471 RepID=A0A1J1GKV9_PLARL|nr:fam-j protein [Plasmodium relictum]CRG85823.1 fam-j protein [Plasmodium relictum]